MSVAALEALRSWYQVNKTTPAFLLALKHRHAMLPGVAEALMADAPGDTDEEKELGLMFSMTQIADQLDIHAILLSGITADMIPASHVDVTPLDATPHDVSPIAVINGFEAEPPKE